MFLLTLLFGCRAPNRKLCWRWTSFVTLWTATKHFVRDATVVTLAALCTQHLLLFVPNSCCSLYPTVADLCTQQGFIALRTRQGFITLQQCGCWAGFCCYRQPSRLPILTCQAYAAVHAISAPVTEVYTCTRTFGVPFNDALQLCTSQDAMWSEHGKPYLGICIMLGGTA